MFRLSCQTGVLSCKRPTPFIQLCNQRKMSYDPHIIVSTLTETLQSIHHASGLPWWAVIPITTFALRSVWTLPLAILQRKRIQKQNSFRPIVSSMFPVFRSKLSSQAQAAQRKALVAEKLEQTQLTNQNSSDQIMKQHFRSTNPATTMNYEQIMLLATKERRKRQKSLFKKHGIQLWKNSILPLFQFPLWIAMSLTMRDLCGWNSWDFGNKPLDTTLYDEGIFWFTNLAAPDSMHVFPVMIGLFALINVEWTFKTLELLKTSRSRILRPTLTDSLANVSRMSVVFMMAISTTAPMALTLYWLSSQVFSLVQNILLDLCLPMGYTPKKRFDYRLASKNAKDVINYDKTVQGVETK